MIISKEYKFSAGHWLYQGAWTPEVNAAVFGPCTRHHGHNYSVEVFVNGNKNEESGMVFNYHDLDKVMEPIIEKADHYILNHVLDSDLTTAENIAEWVAMQILDNLPEGTGLWQVTVKETDKTSAIWRP